ncbi:MAG TPA: hypothetical protein PK677_11755 [Acidiphilium sp.]|nr:hypothetical protein [Acidiphilium sp.]
MNDILVSIGYMERLFQFEIRRFGAFLTSAIYAWLANRDATVVDLDRLQWRGWTGSRGHIRKIATFWL